MVDDLQNVGALHALHSLASLVVVHEDDLLAPGAQQVPAGDHAFVFPLFVENREVEPLIQAENRAFSVLTVEEQENLIALFQKYSDALDNEIQLYRKGTDYDTEAN